MPESVKADAEFDAPKPGQLRDGDHQVSLQVQERRVILLGANPTQQIVASAGSSQGGLQGTNTYGNRCVQHYV